MTSKGAGAMKTMGAVVCHFRRERRSLWEVGIAIMEDVSVHNVQVIVDKDGKALPIVWDYRLHYFKGVITPVSTEEGL